MQFVDAPVGKSEGEKITRFTFETAELTLDSRKRTAALLPPGLIEEGRQTDRLSTSSREPPPYESSHLNDQSRTDPQGTPLITRQERKRKGFEESEGRSSWAG